MHVVFHQFRKQFLSHYSFFLFIFKQIVEARGSFEWSWLRSGVFGLSILHIDRSDEGLYFRLSFNFSAVLFLDILTSFCFVLLRCFQLWLFLLRALWSFFGFCLLDYFFYIEERLNQFLPHWFTINVLLETESTWLLKYLAETVLDWRVTPWSWCSWGGTLGWLDGRGWIRASYWKKYLV